MNTADRREAGTIAREGADNASARPEDTGDLAATSKTGAPERTGPVPRSLQRGTVDISVAIMTHPERLAEAEALAAAHPELAATVVVDPDPGRPGNVACAAAAWKARRPGATHHLVLQDDCRLSKRFVDTVLDLVERYPQQALSLFTYWATGTAAALRTAAAAGCRVAEVRESYFPTVAAVLPAHLADGFGEFFDAYAAELPEADDVAMGAFLYWRGVKRLAVVPTPVEHTGTESLTGNGYQGDRESVCFEDDAEAAGLSWDAAEPDAISGMDPTRAGQEHGYRAERNLPTRFFVAPWTHRHGPKAFTALGAATAETDQAAAVAAFLEAEPAASPLLLSSLWLAGYAFGADLVATPVRTYAPEGPRTPNRLPVDPAAVSDLLDAPVLAQCARAAAKGLGAFDPALSGLGSGSEGTGVGEAVDAVGPLSATGGAGTAVANAADADDPALRAASVPVADLPGGAVAIPSSTGHRLAHRSALARTAEPTPARADRIAALADFYRAAALAGAAHGRRD
ncbi:hypothetical protein [Glycomyces paridis]|uniref:Uncharacterized protein n=1 Tax=Glycomyces paridis TaxID=2126555 RepID=A0A4S8PI00_9ACTN|nr:hypothetical protein [Glycomyces paridis]THV30223.1 hypothetical protein E9998_07580 [Glycomyces paridis]